MRVHALLIGPFILGSAFLGPDLLAKTTTMAR